MAILGVGGELWLKREAPDPVVIGSSSLHVPTNSIYLTNQAYWSGDIVALSCDKGLPFDSDGNGPDCPDGYSMYYGGAWQVGSNRSHVTSQSSSFYKTNNSSAFYMSESVCSLTKNEIFYIYRDQLDRVSFYDSRESAMTGAYENRIPIYNVDFGSLVVSPVGNDAYLTAIAECAASIGDYGFSDVQSETLLASICDFAPTYTAIPAGEEEYDNADLAPRSSIGDSFWIVQCMMTEWSLNLSAPEVDTTAVGEKFGDSVKSIVTGGGSIDFFVEREKFAGRKQDGTALMQLLLLVNKGCKAQARFWMIEDRQETCSLMPGDLFYETELMITSAAINTRVTEVIVGSMNFVTVGEIALKMGVL